MASHTGRRARAIEEAAFARFPAWPIGATVGGHACPAAQQQMLALARGLACEPAVLLLDELSMGLAPLVVEELYENVARIAREGITILVVEQFAKVVLGVANEARDHGARSDHGERKARRHRGRVERGLPRGMTG